MTYGVPVIFMTPEIRLIDRLAAPKRTSDVFALLYHIVSKGK